MAARPRWSLDTPDRIRWAEDCRIDANAAAVRSRTRQSTRPMTPTDPSCRLLLDGNKNETSDVLSTE